VKTLAIDLDGTLAEYDGRFTAGVIGAPITSAVDLIKKLKAEGWKVFIFTSRDESESEAIISWLKKHELSDMFESIYTNKPHYSAFLDDKNVRFSNENVAELIAEVKNNPWWKGVAKG
jgi:adenylylsulfate kinase